MSAMRDTVLVVDDEAASGESICLILADAGFKTVHANNGHQALALLEAFDPALVIADMRMPVMDGRAFVRALNERYARAIPFPVLMVSGLDAALPDGTVAFLRKPIDAKQLVAAVREYVR